MSSQEQKDHFARQLALMLKLPPMTFHLKGVVDSVATDSYFYRIIDITNFFKKDD